MFDSNAVQFQMVPIRDWYEKSEMLETAQTYGFTVTEALFDDWIKRGLLGQAHRAWLGRGRGSIAAWPSAQFTLFLELLRGRQQHKLRVGQLCAFPVWRWIYWGELGGVSLPQVRRVMGTWVTFVKKTSPDTERKEVHRAIEKLQGRQASGKRDLINELTEMGTFAKEADSDLLRYLLAPVVTDSPIRYHMSNGEIRSGDIELIARMYPVRWKAFQSYEQQIAHLPDSVWEWARLFLLFLQQLGQKEQPLLATNHKLASRYRRLTIYDVLWGSCYDFLSPLSIVAQGLFPEEKRDPLPFLNPLVWQERRATFKNETMLMHSPVLLPDGSNVAYLRNDAHIVYQQKEYQFTLDLPFL